VTALIRASFLVFVLGIAAANAQRVQLDDSLSPVDSVHADLDWDQEILERLISTTADQTDTVIPAKGEFPAVDIRLDTSDYVGRRARIYLTLPEPTIDPISVELSWQASGAFLPGSVRPGQSALIFEGLIEQAVTTARFDFFLSIQPGTGSPDRNTLEAIYELELLP